MGTSVREKNNVIYVEPNYIDSIGMYGRDGYTNFEVTPPLEDYSIFVNLEVEKRGRTIQSNSSSNSDTLVLSWIDKGDGRGSVNFMQGSKIPLKNGKYMHSLTTNYTDIHIEDLKSTRGNTEMFGISSIDIAYNNYMVPEVTIKFVDVRGASIFAAKQLAASNGGHDTAVSNVDDNDIATQFFECFFTFPYPKFTLTVKGFYGHPVSYELTLADFRASFESSTGNFSCTAKFVGYYFSFLNDIMINDMFSAPYSDYLGADYWDSMDFRIIGKNGESKTMPKINEIMEAVSSGLTNVKKYERTNPLIHEKKLYEDRVIALRSLKNSYHEYVSIIHNFCEIMNKIPDINTYFNDVDLNGDVKELILFAPQAKSTTFSAYTGDNTGKINGRYASLYKSITNYNEVNNSKIPYPDNIASIYNSTSKVFADNTKVHMKPKKSVATEDIGDVLYDKVSNALEVSNADAVSANEVSVYHPFQSIFHYKDNGFSEYILSLIEQAERRQDEIEEEIQAKDEDSIVEALGFRPTVENMTRIIMAHFETFMYMLYKTGEIISDSKRTIEELKLSDREDLPDVPNRMLPIVPPFPKVTKREYDSKNKSWKRIETWVDNFHGEAFLERDMVHGLLNGAESLKDIMSWKANEGDGSSVGTKYEMPKIHPLTPMDFVSYKKIYGDISKSNISEIIGLVAVRALHILGATTFKNVKDYAKALGRAEGKNLINETNPSKELISKISSLYADEIVNVLNGKKNGSDGLLRKSDSNLWPWQNNNPSEPFMENDGTVKIFDKNNGELSTIPAKDISWERIRSEVFNSESSIYSDDYINTSSKEGGIEISKNNVFNVDFEYKKYAQIVANTLRGFEGLDDFVSNIDSLCTYKKDNYKSFLNISTAKQYIVHNIATPDLLKPYEGSCILPTSIDFELMSGEYKDIKLFGKGFNMNDFHDSDIDGEWKYSNGEKVLRENDNINGVDSYIDDPTKNLSDLTICEFPGVTFNQETNSRRIKLTTTNDVSLFGNSLYYAQKDKRIKALFFLVSVTHSFNLKNIFSQILDKNNTYPMIILPYSSLLLLGGILWWNHVGRYDKTLNIIGLPKNREQEYIGIDGVSDIDNENLLKLRADVRNKFIKTFLDWVEGSDNNNIKSFSDIDTKLELSFTNSGGSETFFNMLGETEETNIIGGSRDWFKKYGYNTLLNFFRGELDYNFFDAYITIDEDVKTFKDGNGKSYQGIRLGNRDTCLEMQYARDIVLTPCILVKNNSFFKLGNETYPKVDPAVMQNFFDGFIQAMKPSEETMDKDKLSIAKETETEEDIKLGVYRYCKLVYDKWVGGITEAKFRNDWTENSFFEGTDRYFYFIDGYYNEIGQDLLINISDFCEIVKNSWTTNNQSLLQLLSTMYSRNKMLFLCLQNFLDLSDRNSMIDMFDPMPYTEIGNIKTKPNFVVIHPYEPSSHLDIEGADYKNDGFMLNDFDNTNEWPEPLRSKSSMPAEGCRLPAFGVSYGKMYQSYFTDIDVSMDNPTVTEQSINAMYNIAAASTDDNGGDSKSRAYTMGQDLFTIYSNNSYTCNVTMLGCTWVQPLMYFVLTNVPMFRGTYLIEKVSHHVEPGSVTTKFMGVRMAKTASAIVKRVTARGNSTNRDSGSKTYDLQDSRNRAARIDNDCPYKTFPLSLEGFDNIESITATNSQKENTLLLMHALVRMGYSKYAAAAVAGNVMSECSFRQDIINGRQDAQHNDGKKGGMCQWQGPRLTRLITDDMNTNSITDSDGPMPSYGKQIKFLDYELKNLYKPSYQTLMSTNSDEKIENAVKVFLNNFEVGDESSLSKRQTYAKQALVEYEKDASNIVLPKAERNADYHINDYPIMLLDALNRSIDYAGSDLNVGIDESKSSGDTVWLVKGRGERDGLSLAFDVLMTAYRNKASEIKWVTDENALPSEPIAIIVNAIDNPNKTKVSVVSKNNISKAITLDKNILSNEGGMNKNFSKTLAKAYKSADNPDLINEVSSLTDSGREAVFGNVNIEKCPVDEQINNIYGSVGKISAPIVVDGEQETLNIEIYLHNLHYWQQNVCEKYEKGPRARSSYGGCSLCTGAINRALRDSGLRRYAGSEFPIDLYKKLKNSGWREISSNTQTNKNDIQLSGIAQRGDICVMWDVNKPYGKTNIHTCSYDGNKWISDFVQNRCNPYTNKPSFNLEWHLMRYNKIV